MIRERKILSKLNSPFIVNLHCSLQTDMVRYQSSAGDEREGIAVILSLVLLTSFMLFFGPTNCYRQDCFLLIDFASGGNLYYHIHHNWKRVTSQPQQDETVLSSGRDGKVRLGYANLVIDFNVLLDVLLAPRRSQTR